MATGTRDGREPWPWPRDGPGARRRRRRHRHHRPHAETLESTAAEIRARGRQAWTVKADMSVPAECQAACERHWPTSARSTSSSTTSATARSACAIQAEPLDTWQRSIDLNLTSCLLGTKLMGRHAGARPRRPDHQHRVDQRPHRQPRHRRARLRDQQGGGHAFHALCRRGLGASRHHRQRHLPGPVHDRHQPGVERAAAGRHRGVRPERADGPRRANPTRSVRWRSTSRAPPRPTSPVRPS